MSTELEPVKPATLTERMDYARALAAAGLLPDVYRDKPANILYAIEYGAALGVPPMTAIMGIHVIQGKPTLSADLMAALIRRAGHRLRVRVENRPHPSGQPVNPDIVAIAELNRHDDPEYTFRSEWTEARAKAAGLLGKDNWKHYLPAMLKARAISEVGREGASEVLNGLIYTPEEMGANTDEDGAPIAEGHVVEDQPPPTRARFAGDKDKPPDLHIRHADGSREPLNLPTENADTTTSDVISGQEFIDAFPDDTKQEKP